MTTTLIIDAAVSLPREMYPKAQWPAASQQPASRCREKAHFIFPMIEIIVQMTNKSSAGFLFPLLLACVCATSKWISRCFRFLPPLAESPAAVGLSYHHHRPWNRSYPLSAHNAGREAASYPVTTRSTCIMSHL